MDKRVNIIDEVMPGHNGSESIVGYIIRTRNEKRAAAAKRARLIRLACITLWPCAALITVMLTQPIIEAALFLR